MTDNIQKLYEIAGVEKECKTFKSIMQCTRTVTKCDECVEYEHPPFTVEKQLELIKWIAHKAHNGLLINKHITDGGASMVFDNLGYESTLASSFISFEECLAKLVNNLWQDLAEEQKQEIKRILE